MIHFSLSNFNVLYVFLAPRAKPEGLFRGLGGVIGKAENQIIYTIVKTLAKAAMSVPNKPHADGVPLGFWYPCKHSR